MRTATILAFVAAVALLAGSIGIGLRDRSAKRAAVDQALTNKAGDGVAQLDEYFARARSINLITAHNPSFREFYAEPGSRIAKVRARGHAIRGAENGLAYVEKLYPASIGEVCFIDRNGPENARFVNRERAKIADLSPDESANPFFAPTFALHEGQVFQAKPYVSPDTHEWVISNSTPLPGTGYPAAAMVHFEVTVASFQRTAAAIAKDDELAIVDAKTGKIVIDSRTPQRLGAPLGRPTDHRFEGLAAQGGLVDATTIGGHAAAVRRLRRTQHNENDLYAVAVGARPVGSLLGSAGWAPLGMAGAALALLLMAAISFRSGRRTEHEIARARESDLERGAAERAYHETQREFTEIMQITRDEDEAYGLLKRYLERSLVDSDVLVINRNNSHDRLEPMTKLDGGSALAERLKSAEPDACLAVRLGKMHERNGEHEPLLACDLCGPTATSSTCVPSLVGGEVIGSVLVQHPAPLDGVGKRRLEASMTQASPVLANLRNMALSQMRAMTDGLTGLPNRRSIEDTLKRMTAHADRTSTPLGAVLFDLDHFKQINDLFGHEKGDEVLAGIGAIVTSTLRASDFAGRYGGEEFIVLLPDTDREGTVLVAEKLRLAIEAVEVAGVSRPITASLGVAAIPADASEPAFLVRAADRALYLAKSKGRNRVVMVSAEEPDLLASPAV